MCEVSFTCSSKNCVDLITLFRSSSPLDRQVVNVAREGGVVQSRVGGVKERENKGGYSARSNT